MTEPIKPALTAEEWGEGEFDSHYGLAKTSLQIDHKGRVFAHSQMDGKDEIVILNEAVDAEPVRHALAALALHGQPFGFTREDVELLRRLILSGRQHWWFDVEEVESITDRIEALLPKEGA